MLSSSLLARTGALLFASYAIAAPVENDPFDAVKFDEAVTGTLAVDVTEHQNPKVEIKQKGKPITLPKRQDSPTTPKDVYSIPNVGEYWKTLSFGDPNLSSINYIQMNTHGCDNVVVKGYHNATTGEPTPDISWADLVIDLDRENDASIATGGQTPPKYRDALWTGLIEEAGGYTNGIKEIFDANILTLPQAAPNGGPADYRIFRPYTVKDMALLLFAHGTNQTFSFAIQATEPPARPAKVANSLSLSVAAFVYIGQVLNGLLDVVGNHETHPTLGVQDVEIAWATMTALRRLYDVSMNTLRGSPLLEGENGDITPVMEIDEDQVKLAIRAVESGALYSKQGSFEVFEDLLDTMQRQDWNPSANGACGPYETA